MAIDPITHLEQVITGQVEPVTHLEQVIAKYGGGGGTSDYTLLSNKPSINGTTLVGALTLADLGLSDIAKIKGRVDTVEDLPDDAQAGWIYFVGLETDSYKTEYVYTLSENWEKLGDTDIKLSEYAKSATMSQAEYEALTTKEPDRYYFLTE